MAQWVQGGATTRQCSKIVIVRNVYRRQFSVSDLSHVTWMCYLFIMAINFAPCRRNDKRKGENISAAILAAADAAISSSGFELKGKKTEIISGVEEAASGWVTANYLMKGNVRSVRLF